MLRHLINPGLELRQVQPPDAPVHFAVIDADHSGGWQRVAAGV